MPAEKRKPMTIDSDRAIVAILFLLAAERDERLGSDGQDRSRRTELVLAEAGLTLGEIAAVTGRKYMAVAKTLSRARGTGVSDGS